MRNRILILLSVLMLLLTACGGDDGGSDTTEGGAETTAAATEAETTMAEETEAETTMAEDTATTMAEAAPVAELECNSVQVIVPYSAGGGSDQQVRRLQPALEEILGLRLQITYQEGGDGSVGWNALAGAEPDGCTIANVVAPNIINLSLTAGEEVGFSAEEFEYFGWTEFSPNIVGVATDSEFETFEDFVTAAEASPGELTISGVGGNGELLVSEVLAATGLDLTFVPFSGGVGDIIPQIAGGHIDAALSGFSLLDGDQVRPLVLSAESEAFPDIPTFSEAGYEGVTLVTSWGLILPPGTPPEIVEYWNGALQDAMADPGVQEAYAETGFTVLIQNTEEARAYFQEQFDATQAAIEAAAG